MHDVRPDLGIEPWESLDQALRAPLAAQAAQDGAARVEQGPDPGRAHQGLHAALADLPGIEVFPGAANFLLVRGPEGLVDRLARRGVLVRGCAPFAGLGPSFFRVAVRGGEDNAALVEAVRGTL